MVGLGPTIHEFLGARLCGTSKLVDGRAKHDHDEGERPRSRPLGGVPRQSRNPLHRHPGLEPGSISPRLVRLTNGSRFTPLMRLSGMTFGQVEALVRKLSAPPNVSRETRKSVTV
jgi:hypothetical protein